MDRLSAGLDLEAIASLGGARILRGDPRFLVYRLATLASAGPDELSFLSDGRYLAQARSTRAGAALVRAADADALPAGCAVLASEDPYRSFAAVAREVAARLAPRPMGGRDPSALVAEDARIGRQVWIGPHSVIGPGCVIGDGAVLGAGVVLGARVSVGAGSVLYPKVTVYDRCALGARAIVHAGAVIGADGFGFAPAGGDWEKIPQLGAVVIGDDVEIG
ncbi:MAG: UDP-3-O-(3-hydroxymyristoyl)glucosamine N-acyltransferase, partial [Gammaproteobacteria bacterium]